MRASDSERQCQEAQVYYYDLLCPDEGAVPPSVRRHAATCPVCREQMRRLREALFESGHSPSRVDSWEDETIEALAEQFRLLDEHVRCSDAKPYLPELAAVSPRIRIPTPVTVHVDLCRSCAEDLRTIQGLHLTDGQLKRLGRFFKSDPGESVPPSDLRRDAPTAGAQPSDPVACHDISTADLFDFVVPCGRAPDERQAPDARQGTVASHIRTCPACRAKVQTLHRTISGIAERANSETQTVYHAESDAEGTHGETADTYRYPVSVEVLQGPSSPTVNRGVLPADQTARPRGLERSARWFGPPKRDRSRLRRAAGGAAIAGAVIALTLFVRMTTPTASGLLDNDVLKALAKVRNIRVVTTSRNGSLLQEYCIARRSNRLMKRTAQKCVLYDLDRDRKETIELQTGIRVSVRLDKSERDWARQTMASRLGDVLERISPDTRLDPPPGDLGREGIQDLDVHELSVRQYGGNAAGRARWWAYIDPATGLPQKMEYHQMGPPQNQWDLSTTTVFIYPTEQEMEDVIQALFPAP